MRFFQYVKAQTALVSPQLNAASGATVKGEGVMSIVFFPSGITYAAGDVVTVVLYTGTSISTSTPTCVEGGFGEFDIASCSYASATRTLTVTFGSTVNASPLQIMINVSNFVYPPTSFSGWPESGGATVTLYSSGGTKKGEGTNVKIYNVNPATIPSSNIVITPDASKPAVGATGATIKFSVTVTNTVPAGGSITIYFPVQPVTSSDVVTSPTCVSADGTMSASLSCSFSSTTHTLTITNILTSDSSGTLNFTVSGIRNPISTAPVTGIIVQTIGTDTGAIDSGTGSWSVSTPATITTASWGLQSSTVVSTNSNHRVSFTLSFPVEANPTATIVFPNDVTIDSTLSSYTGVGLFATGSSFLTKTSSTISIQGSTSSSGSSGIDYVNSLTLLLIKNPNKVKTTSSLSITLYTSGGHQIATVTSGVSIAASSLTTGSISISSITPDNLVVQSTPTSYTVVFNPASPLPSTESTRIVVKFPSTITLTSTCAFSGVAGQLLGTLTCAADSAAYTYTLSSPFGSNSYASTTTNLQIKLGNVTNPNLQGNPGTFTVTTYLSDDGGANYYPVDTGTYASVSITTGTLTLPIVTPSSTLAYATGVTYTISFTTQHSVVANGYITITFPSTIIISDTSAAISGCEAGLNTGGTTSAAACTVSSSTSITITNLFSSGAGAGNVYVKIPGVRNPRMTGTSNSLTVTTSDNSGTSIDSLGTGFTVNMLTVSDLQSVSIDNIDDPEVNGEFNTYKLIVTAKTPTQNGDKLIVQFPDEVTFPSSSSDLSCAAGTNITSISCAMNTGTKTITATITTFTTSVLEGAQFDFTISTIKNPISLEPAAMRAISLVDSAGASVNSYTSVSSLTIVNTEAAKITVASLGQTDDGAGDPAIYTFTFTPINAIPQHAIIELIYPASVTPSSSLV